VNVPCFTQFKVWRLNLRCHGKPQSRGRAFLISFCRDFEAVVGGMPSRPAESECMSLEDCLVSKEAASASMHHKKPSAAQAANLALYRVKFAAAIAHEDPGNSHFGVVDISRKPPQQGHKGFKSAISIGYCPTLSTKNSYLWIFASTAVSEKVPAQGRFMCLEERAVLSGVHWPAVQDCCSSGQHIINFGNCIPVDLVAAVLRQVMEKWAIFEYKILDQTLGSPFRNYVFMEFAAAVVPKVRISRKRAVGIEAALALGSVRRKLAFDE
jgi:site-specific DNA-cytosine methylase